MSLNDKINIHEILSITRRRIYHLRNTVTVRILRVFTSRLEEAGHLSLNSSIHASINAAGPRQRLQRKRLYKQKLNVHLTQYWYNLVHLASVANYDTIRYGRFTCAQKLTRRPA